MRALKKFQNREGILFISIYMSLICIGLIVDSYGKSTLKYIGGDVKNYLYMFQALANGNFSASVFQFGIGFPLLGFLGAPFFENPLFLPSILLYSYSCYLLFKILREFYDTKIAVVLFVLIVATMPFNHYFMKSLNIILNIPIVLILFYNLLKDRTPSFSDTVILGILFGLSFSSRYIDVFFFIPVMLLFFVQMIHRKERGIVIRIFCFFSLSALFLLITLYFHSQYLGSIWHTPYDHHIPFTSRLSKVSEGISTHMATHNFVDLPRNLFQTLIVPGPYALEIDIRGYKTLLQSMPYLIFLPYGIAQCRKRFTGMGLFSLSTSMILFFAFYGSHWAFTTHDLRYHCLRYLSSWYPVLAILSMIGISHLLNGLRKKESIRKRALTVNVAIILIVFLFPYLDMALREARVISRDQYTLNIHEKTGKSHPITADSLSDYIEIKSLDQNLSVDFKNQTTVGELFFDLREDSENYFPHRVALEVSTDGTTFHTPEGLRIRRQNHYWIFSFDATDISKIRVIPKKLYQYKGITYPFRFYRLDILS